MGILFKKAGKRKTNCSFSQLCPFCRTIFAPGEILLHLRECYKNLENFDIEQIRIIIILFLTKQIAILPSFEFTEEINNFIIEIYSYICLKCDSVRHFLTDIPRTNITFTKLEIELLRHQIFSEIDVPLISHSKEQLLIIFNTIERWLPSLRLKSINQKYINLAFYFSLQNPIYNYKIEDGLYSNT